MSEIEPLGRLTDLLVSADPKSLERVSEAESIASGLPDHPGWFRSSTFGLTILAWMRLLPDWVCIEPRDGGNPDGTPCTRSGSGVCTGDCTLGRADVVVPIPLGCKWVLPVPVEVLG